MRASAITTLIAALGRRGRGGPGHK